MNLGHGHRPILYKLQPDIQLHITLGSASLKPWGGSPPKLAQHPGLGSRHWPVGSLCARCQGEAKIWDKWRRGEITKQDQEIV